MKESDVFLKVLFTFSQYRIKIAEDVMRYTAKCNKLHPDKDKM